MKTINSLNNKNFKYLKQLKKAGFRKERGLILVDGAREIKLALKYGWELDSAYYCETLARKKSSWSREFLGLANSKIFFLPEKSFKEIAYKENPDGFLAVFEQKNIKLEKVKLEPDSLLIILDSPEKPGNLGAVIRTSAAAGVGAVLVDDNKVDLYNPNVIRASEGEIFSQNLVRSSFSEITSWLKEKKIKLFAATKEAKLEYSQADLSGSVAIVLGSESSGLSERWRQAADEFIKIPIKREVDSLNLSVATAVIIFESMRQRKLKL